MLRFSLGTNEIEMELTWRRNREDDRKDSWTQSLDKKFVGAAGAKDLMRKGGMVSAARRMRKRQRRRNKIVNLFNIFLLMVLQGSWKTLSLLYKLMPKMRKKKV